MRASSVVAVASTGSYPKIFWGQCDRRLAAGQSLMRATRIGLWRFAELQLHGLARSELGEASDH